MTYQKTKISFIETKEIRIKAAGEMLNCKAFRAEKNTILNLQKWVWVTLQIQGSMRK